MASGRSSRARYKCRLWRWDKRGSRAHVLATAGRSFGEDLFARLSKVEATVSRLAKSAGCRVLDVCDRLERVELLLFSCSFEQFREIDDMLKSMKEQQSSSDGSCIFEPPRREVLDAPCVFERPRRAVLAPVWERRSRNSGGSFSRTGARTSRRLRRKLPARDDLNLQQNHDRWDKRMGLNMQEPRNDQACNDWDRDSLDAKPTCNQNHLAAKAFQAPRQSSHRSSTAAGRNDSDLLSFEDMIARMNDIQDGDVCT
eukprot:TRINITY_DN102099_c0_g1_i1.p1 TRINITY_DN102099_c0_g1~~TRINITY_DN102099_c0_g1_i1.p1  ORF type:complete len:279 (+),score=38.58 TRINITY_DN102099_c0_g1_i1:70-837(+)